MASITITVGAVSATKNYADNQKVAQVLGLFADEAGIPDTLPAQERLDATLAELVRYLVFKARKHYLRDHEAAAQVGAGAINVE